MSFCPDINTVFTTDSLNQTFGSATLQGILPAGGFSGSDRETTGILKQDVVKQYVNTLASQGKLPLAPNVTGDAQAIEDYMKKDNGFISALKDEYCFYNSRYKYALRQLIAKLQEGYITTDVTKRRIVEDYLEKTRVLNTKLNDITQISNEITKKRLESAQSQNSQINSINGALQSRSAVLAEQYKILSSEQANATLYKNMEKYTRERANATNNMLGMYSFMNIVMIGTLVYLYRSMSE